MEDGGRLSDSHKVHKAEMEITDGIFFCCRCCCAVSAFLDLAELKSVGDGCCRHNMLCDTHTKKQPRLCNGAIIKSSIVVSSFFCGGNKAGPLASLVLFRQSAYSCCG